MAELTLNLTASTDTDQLLKNLGGLRDDAEELEERISTLESSGYSVKLSNTGADVTVEVTAK